MCRFARCSCSSPPTYRGGSARSRVLHEEAGGQGRPRHHWPSHPSELRRFAGDPVRRRCHRSGGWLTIGRNPEKLVGLHPTGPLSEPSPAISGEPLKKIFVAILLSVFVVPAVVAQADDVTKPIRQFIDGFNSGDTKSAFAAYASGSVSITDEFAPHLWMGPNAARAWAADYDKHAKATGVTDGSVKYGEPTRKEIEGNLAYVVIPTVYNYKENGKPTQEEGQMTFVLRRGSGGWE